MSNNRSSIESDYVFVDNPGQDELQEDYGFVIVARDAESPEVVQHPHELEVNPTPWLRQAPRKLPNTRFRPRLSPKLYVRPTEGQTRPKLQQDSPAIKEGKEMKAMELPNTRFRPGLSPKSYSLPTEGRYRPKLQQDSPAIKEANEPEAVSEANKLAPVWLGKLMEDEWTNMENFKRFMYPKEG